MKKENILKSLGDLPPVTTQTADPASPKSVRPSLPEGELTSEIFREMLLKRSIAPIVPAIPYHRWGLNE